MMKKVLYECEKILSGMKFAIVLLVIMAIMMIVATFVESISGTEIANLLIYKSSIFIFFELLLFLSVSFSMLKRLPFRKSFLGFYILHSGILLLLLGSFITYYSGIDGQLRLVPMGSNSIVELPHSVLYVEKNGGELLTAPLPNSIFPKELDFEVDEIKLGKYYPFAVRDLDWKNSEMAQSLELTLQGRTVIMSTGADQVEFSPLQNFEGLQVLLIASEFESCFARKNKDDYIIVNYHEMKCSLVDKKEVQISKSSNKFFLFEHDGQSLKFFPNMTPYPMDETHSFVSDTQAYAISMDRVANGSILVISPRRVVLVDSNGNTLLDGHDDIIRKFERFKLHANKKPILTPTFRFPTKNQNGELVTQKYIELEFDGREYLLSSGQTLSVRNKQNDDYRIYLGQAMFKLGYELKLKKFDMKMNPGTQMPASYESFVSVRDGSQRSEHHIYMNNPLRYGQFMFYQSSYFQTEQGNGSILSVNYDPGRLMKYLGSIMLILGAALHYLLRLRG